MRLFVVLWNDYCVVWGELVSVLVCVLVEMWWGFGKWNRLLWVVILIDMGGLCVYSLVGIGVLRFYVWMSLFVCVVICEL